MSMLRNDAVVRLAEPARTRRHLPLSAIAVFVVAFWLGFWGFAQAMPERTGWTWIYLALQLGSLESGALVEDPPLALEVARWLAPAAVFGGLLAAGWGWFVGGARLWLLRRRRNHAVVIGMGRKGVSFARALLQADARPVVVGLEVDEGVASAALTNGRSGVGGRIREVVVGDARYAASLRAAGVWRAAKVFVVTGSDAVNLAVLSALESSGPAAESIYVHVADSALRRALQRGRRSDAAATIRYESHYGSQARRLLLLWPPETVHPSGATDPTLAVHLVLLGRGALQHALVLEVAAACHYAGGRKVHVHLVDEHADQALERWEAGHPALRSCLAALQAHPASRGTELAAAARLLARFGPDAMVTVLPAANDAARMHADVLRLRETGCRARVRFLLPCASMLAGAAEPADAVLRALQLDPGLAGTVGYFDEDAVLGECAIDGVDGRSDGVARTIHEAWFAGQVAEAARLDAAGAGDRAAALRAKTTHRPWSELSEAQRLQSYSQAAHYPIKVRAAGFDGRTWSEPDLHAADLETLTRMEHERWMACQRLLGWRHGAQRDDAARLHPDLVPFDDLSEATKQYDRDAVLRMAELRDLLQSDWRALDARRRQAAGEPL